MSKKTHSDLIDDDFDLDDKDSDISLGSLVLYSNPQDISSHRIRLICSIKKLEISIREVDVEDPDSWHSFLSDVNEMGILPTITDRSFVKTY